MGLKQGVMLSGGAIAELAIVILIPLRKKKEVLRGLVDIGLRRRPTTAKR